MSNWRLQSAGLNFLHRATYRDARIVDQRPKPIRSGFFLHTLNRILDRDVAGNIQDDRYHPSFFARRSLLNSRGFGK